MSPCSIDCLLDLECFFDCWAASCAKSMPSVAIFYQLSIDMDGSVPRGARGFRDNNLATLDQCTIEICFLQDLPCSIQRRRRLLKTCARLTCGCRRLWQRHVDQDASKEYYVFRNNFFFTVSYRIARLFVIVFYERSPNSLSILVIE